MTVLMMKVAKGVRTLALLSLVVLLNLGLAHAIPWGEHLGAGEAIGWIAWCLVSSTAWGRWVFKSEVEWGWRP